MYFQKKVGNKSHNLTQYNPHFNNSCFFILVKSKLLVVLTLRGQLLIALRNSSICLIRKGNLFLHEKSSLDLLIFLLYLLQSAPDFLPIQWEFLSHIYFFFYYVCLPRKNCSKYLLLSSDLNFTTVKILLILSMALCLPSLV